MGAISEFIMNASVLLELNMSHNKVSDKGINKLSSALQKNATLKTFDISHDNLSANRVSTFSNFLIGKHSLHQLRISWDYVKDIHLDLCTLQLYRKYIGDTGVILVSSFLYHSSILQELNLSYNNISNGGAVAISVFLKDTALQELNFSHNSISDNGIVIIGKALRTNRKLKIFDISYNNISDNGAVAIAICLKNNCILQELNLLYNAVPYSAKL